MKTPLELFEDFYNSFSVEERIKQHISKSIYNEDEIMFTFGSTERNFEIGFYKDSGKQTGIFGWWDIDIWE